MEKHWKSVVPRTICDYFFSVQRKVTSNDDIPPVIAAPHHYLINIIRNNLVYIAVCVSEGNFLAHNAATRLTSFTQNSKRMPRLN